MLSGLTQVRESDTHCHPLSERRRIQPPEFIARVPARDKINFACTPRQQNKVEGKQIGDTSLREKNCNIKNKSFEPLNQSSGPNKID